MDKTVTMTQHVPGSQAWLDAVREDIIEPQRPIVDPHHHLWPAGAGLNYGLDELHADIDSGHNIVRTVFVECGAAYDTALPPHLACTGETRFVAGESRRDPRHIIGGIVAKADLRRDDLNDILDAHEREAGDLFKGIRDALSHALHPESLTIPGRATKDLHADPLFRRGVAALASRGLTYDSWQYHHQAREFLELARAVPQTTMVLDHFSTPLGVGPYAGERDEIFRTWKTDIAEIAKCPNVVAKLGGLAMPDNGFGWNNDASPPTSDDVVRAQAPWYEHTIECFGPDRCMFESNFPVDRFSLSYHVFWNAAKKFVSSYSEPEKDAMFRGTATRVYRLALP